MERDKCKHLANKVKGYLEIAGHAFSEEDEALIENTLKVESDHYDDCKNEEK